MQEKIKIQIIEGDITSSNAEAIVNAANNHLWMGSGVAGAIKRVGGKIIEDEAVAKGPIPIGSAIETTAGNLKAKYVIHAAVMGQDLTTNEKYIRDATRSVLELCEKLNLKSVAFPALGTGVGGFPLEECAKIMINEVLNFNAKQVKEVYFYLFGNQAYKIFQEVYQQLSK
ncbi:MAG: macro domain-containing protein [Ignavibacteria bacterium]|nr:macro domain-containing protein [Ignavibacteria bacterium]